MEPVNGAPNYASRSGKSKSPAPQRETVAHLLVRLQQVDGDIIRLFTTLEGRDAPILVQRALLSRIFHNSPWFKRALNCMDSRSSDELQIDIDEDIFAMFIYWLFHQRIPEIFDIENSIGIPDQEAKDEYQTLLVRTWAFADNIELPKFQNDVMRALFDTFNDDDRHLTPEALQACLLVSESGTRMRAALVQYMLWWDELTEHLREWVPVSSAKLQSMVNLEVIEGIRQDIDDWQKIHDVLEESGECRGRPRAEQFLMPVA